MNYISKAFLIVNAILGGIVWLIGSAVLIGFAVAIAKILL